MKKLVVIAVSCLAVGSLAACGGSSKNSASTGTTVKASASASANANVNTAAASDLLKYCDYSKAAQAFSPTSGLSNPNSFKDELNNLKANADAYVNVAPTEIKSDVRVYIDDFLTPLITEMQRVNYDFTKVNPNVFTSLQDAKVQAALKNIGDYYVAHCHK